MFTKPRIYDLNAQTSARQHLNAELTKKKVERSSHFPTVVEPNFHISQTPQMGTPAYIMSLKQRQQARDYAVNQFPQSQSM